jgi:hypothetical protein
MREGGEGDGEGDKSQTARKPGPIYHSILSGYFDPVFSNYQQIFKNIPFYTAAI